MVKNRIDFYLLCNTDLPWVADPVRENGGEKREKLFERYKLELEHYGFDYSVVSGSGKSRIKSALMGLKHFFGPVYIENELK